MTDRELLEYAAKAAGYVHEVSPIDPQQHRPKHWANWNPLTDDGDALRLAVRLDILVTPRNAKNKTGYQAVEAEGNGPYAATRRAIVRAAAEIGKAMP